MKKEIKEIQSFLDGILLLSQKYKIEIFEIAISEKNIKKIEKHFGNNTREGNKSNNQVGYKFWSWKNVFNIRSIEELYNIKDKFENIQKFCSKIFKETMPK